MFEGLDHYAVLAKMKIKGRWEYGKSNGKGICAHRKHSISPK